MYYKNGSAEANEGSLCILCAQLQNLLRTASPNSMQVTRNCTQRISDRTPGYRRRGKTSGLEMCIAVRIEPISTNTNEQGLGGKTVETLASQAFFKLCPRREMTRMPNTMGQRSLSGLNQPNVSETRALRMGHACVFHLEHPHRISKDFLG